MGKRLNPIVDVPFGKTKQQHNLYYKRWQEINREDYNKNGKTIRFFHIDHCHKTNKIRGILCQSCNIGIGKLKDSVKVLESAISYIRNSTNVDDKAINIHDVQTS